MPLRDRVRGEQSTGLGADPAGRLARSARMKALTERDLEGFRDGRDGRAFDKLGAHPDADGARFAVWAPNAEHVEVASDMNDWRGHGLERLGGTGVWQGYVRGAVKGMRYKYRVHSKYGGYAVEKADPYGRLHEVAPGTASIVWTLDQ